MFVLLNGSFGIGKTTTANLLAEKLPLTAISDPEHVGFIVRRLPAWMLGLPRQPGDYQDIKLWRRLIVLQARLVHLRSKIVIVPMAFTNLDYLDAFADALGKTAPVNRICLVAQLDTVRARLERRAVTEGRPGLTDFELRRSAECVAAHGNAAFGVPVDASGEPMTVVARVSAAVGQ